LQQFLFLLEKTMKKQILAAAVAATLAVPAMADISITGSANFEYFHNTLKSKVAFSEKETTNETDTEINLNVRGQAGDTKVVLDLEFDTHGNGTLDVEDSYLTTKVGPVGFKGGNYSSSTSGILGEIEHGDRATSKFQLDYTTNGIQFYAGNSGDTAPYQIDHGDTAINGNMFAGVKATVEGWTLQAKKNNEDKWSLGAQGVAGPVGIRFEYANADTIDGASDSTKDRNSGYFLNLTGAFDNVNVGLATIQMDGDGGITEDDSSVFAVENDFFDVSSSSTLSNGNSNTQLSANTTIDGTTYAAYIGQIGYETANMDDIDYWAIAAIRPLASGAKLTVVYANAEGDWQSAKTTDMPAAASLDDADYNLFEIDLSVKF
jgi:hypothetical protein